MTTEINKNLTQYCGKEGLEYQITVNDDGRSGHSNGYIYLCLTKAELDALVLAYIKFKLGA
jgi:hypothetical protein